MVLDEGVGEEDLGARREEIEEPAAFDRPHVPLPRELLRGAAFERLSVIPGERTNRLLEHAAPVRVQPAPVRGALEAENSLRLRSQRCVESLACLLPNPRRLRARLIRAYHAAAVVADGGELVERDGAHRDFHAVIERLPGG